MLKKPILYLWLILLLFSFGCTPAADNPDETAVAENIPSGTIVLGDTGVNRAEKIEALQPTADYIAAQLHGYGIGVIEDDAVQAAIFERALSNINYKPEVITDGQMALDHLATAVPALIMLDLHLPTITGEDILAYIRTNDRLKSTRVIVASADGTMADQLPYKADLILHKPVSIFQLQQLATRFHPDTAS